MSFNLINKKTLLFILLFLLAGQVPSFAQKFKWMSVGSLQDYFTEKGFEWEEAIAQPISGVKDQQTGWLWPADHKYMDSEAARGMWVGCTNFTDTRGNVFPNKVVHVGPRGNGTGEFFPIKFYMKSKFPKPVITVEGNNSIGPTDADVDIVDPTMVADREIVNVCNTQIGLTMTRRIFQFSQQFNDNYIVTEYTFKNTGDTDGDTTTIEMPANTLTGIVVSFQYRNAPCNYVGNQIGNSSRWGISTMNDVRGDGLKLDPPGEQFRCQFSWMGHYAPYVPCDNIGGPVWNVVSPVVKGDTIGRLAGFQFMGTVTLHADKSAIDKADDISQPTTTCIYSSDGDLCSNNDAFNIGKMAKEYALITSGHETRHIDQIKETDLLNPTKDPGMGTSGGMSYFNGYGPYTLKHGESFTLVIAQASAGMGWEAGEKVGVQYKADLKGGMEFKAATKKKNTEVMKGKDSLMTTFARALDNYKNNWGIQNAPKPPKTIDITGLGDRVTVNWTVYDEGDPETTGFQVWRAIGRVDSTYHLMAELPATGRSYDDVTAPRGADCYYRVLTVGKAIAANPALNIQATRLVSSKFYGQAFDPATLKRQPGTDMDKIRIVPNPFSLGANPQKNLAFPDRRDRLYFYELPGKCTIKIYTEIGELIKTIDHVNGSGDDYWDCVTSSNQILVTGIYIAVVQNQETGASKIVKFVVIR